VPTTRRSAQEDATPYALLGLLSVRPWTTYELAQQVRRSLHWFWPRAERKLYDDPKRLAAGGLAATKEEYTGKRRRTVYSITAKGRRELRAWLGTPSAEPSWENEALVKVFFADAGDLASLRRTLSEMRDVARRRLAELGAMAREEPLFPQRRHLGALSIRLQQEHEEATARWAEWALEQTATWRASDDPGSWDPESVYGPLGRVVDDGTGDALT
jgi:PadR family transcriptional regulator, regulatory protein AphA